MYEMRVVVEGVAPFLFNRMTEAAAESFKSGQTGGTKTNDQRVEEAKDKVYLDSHGLFLPAWNIKRGILDGAGKTGMKWNKRALWQHLSAMLFIQDVGRFTRAGIPLKEADGLSQVPGRTPPKRGVATIVRRPVLTAGWQLRWSMSILDDGIDPKLVRASVEALGLQVGLGSWRPEAGRFLVLECEGAPSRGTAKPAAKAVAPGQK